MLAPINCMASGGEWVTFAGLLLSSVCSLANLSLHMRIICSLFRKQSALFAFVLHTPQSSLVFQVLIHTIVLLFPNNRLSGIKLDSRLQRWLLKQRFLWRAGRLPHERVAMFWTAGIDLNDYSRHAWVQLAYETASFVNGFDEKWSKDICHDAHNQEKDPQLSPRLYVKPEDVMAVTKDGDVIEWPVEQKVSSLLDGTSVIVNGINGLHVDASLESDLTLQRKVNGSNGNELAHVPARGGRKQSCADEVRRRLKVRRWVLTQQALFRESRLSEQQIRHMIFLGEPPCDCCCTVWCLTRVLAT